MRALLIAFTIAIVAATTLTASTRRHLDALFGVGLSFPAGDLNEGWAMGFHGSAGFSIPVSPVFDLIPRLEYHQLPFDDHGFISVNGGSFSALMFGLDCQLEPRSRHARFAPVFLVGAGVAHVSFTDLRISGYGTFYGSNETKPYVSLGAGVEFLSSEDVCFTLMARYISYKTTGTSITIEPFTTIFRF